MRRNPVQIGVETAPRSREMLFGCHETVDVPVDSLVLLSQVRGNKNPESEALKDSIHAKGLLNPIDVARVSQDELEAYIAFVNHTWGADIQIESYDPRRIDGQYYLVVAGHSRTTAVMDIAREMPDTRAIIRCKLHPISSPGDIVNLQLQENIHSTPPKERVAMAIVESYLWGVEHKLWTNKEDFLRQHKGRVSSGQLDKALGFASLPHYVRQFVLAGHMPYLAALELGGAMDSLYGYELQQLGFAGAAAIQPDQKDLIAGAVTLRINEIIMHISTKRLNSVAAQKYIAGLQHAWAPASSQAHTDDMLLLIGADEQAQQYIRSRRRAVQDQLNAVGTMPVWQAATLIDMVAANANLDADTPHELLHGFAGVATRMLGEAGINLANHSDRAEIAAVQLASV